MSSALDFRHDTASQDDMVSHLREADRSFVPPLSDRVDIDAYAAKLSRAGTRREAWAGLRLVGLLAGYLNDRETGTGFISSLSVVPGWERRGISAKLVASFITGAKLAGMRKLALEVHVGNLAAVSFYRSVGFLEDNRHGEVMTMSLEIDEAK